ncbi:MULTISPECIES: hypothetical protein [Paenibacillus]|uniref:hypothetical protein n=1 Tax=Paenibacillus TaxID=44249 RepID=UPI0004F7EF08|nr:hypothetical protein [Paenibacillus odorifer]AIQ76657.1 hypothetical protein PODO_27455 [Paenibacillus odorifer]OMC96863.1 hypothetical protein BJP46_27560 [Paenibacillus odorifer]OMD04155.1 hypothetical protein BJP49_24890 [Paenibacillus odorifer]OMD26444.1 hypothetical protein BJP48_22680 [Paenibacillus odorifer]OME15486.1 hypothetical protein BSK57_27955 [Paenibacillus odorifer]
MAGVQNNIAGIQQVSNQWINDITNQITTQVSANISNSFSATLNRISMKIVNKPVYNITNNYSAAYTRIQASIGGAVQAQERLNDAADRGAGGAEKQAGTWEKLTGAFEKAKGMVEKVKGVMEKVLVPAAEQQKWEDLFKAKTGNADVGVAMFDKFKKRALETGQDVSKSMESVLSFYPKTQNTDQLDKLMDYSTRLSMMSPEGKDIGDTSSAINSAFDGDSSDLASMLQVDEEELGGLDLVASTGNMGAFLSTLGDIMTTAGMTSTSLQTMMDSPVNQWQTLLGNYNNSLAGMGQGALAAFSPLLSILNDAFSEGTFQPIIDGMAIGLAIIAQGFSQVVQGALFLWSVLSSTLPYVVPILLGIVAGIIAYKIAMGAAAIATNMSAIATGIATAAQGIYNAVLNANPIALVIGLVIALIVAFLGIVAALQPVRDFLANMFRALGQIVADFVGYVIDLWTGFINGIIDAANFLLGGINKVIGAVGKFIGIESEINLHLERVDSSQFKQNVEMSIENTFDTAAKYTQEFDVNKFKESLNVGGNTNNETTINQWNTTHQDDSTKPPKSPTIPEVPVVPVTKTPALNTPSAVGSFQNAGVPGNLNTVNRVNELGSINDTVDISSDDLKMLRELAEIQAIQNFVELTPTVQVTTGNINNAGDIDTIINKIGQKLNEEFVSTAQGVYT